MRIASNPTDGDLYLYPEGDFSDEVFQLSWLDMEGRLLEERTVLFDSRGNPIHFDVHRWAPGIYILRISQGNEVRTYKIVKHWVGADAVWIILYLILYSFVLLPCF